MADEIDASTSSSASVDVDLISDVAAPQTFPRARIQWPGGPSIKQSFSLPESIMYYIAKNPSSVKDYMKLVKSCKYFFETNPIIVAARVHGDSKICSKTLKECESNEEKCCIDFDIEKLSSKIWLTGELFLNENTDPNYTSILSSKLYRCENDELVLFDKTVLWDDFKFLASSVTMLGLKNVKVTNYDGGIISIEEILECFPKLIAFSFSFNNFKSGCSTLKNITKLNDLKHLTGLRLFDVSEIFKVEDISNVMMAHKEMSLVLRFDNTISPDYKNQLDALIDKIIMESDTRVGVITYDGQDEGKLEYMNFCMALALVLLN